MPPRTVAQRRADTLRALASHRDVWVASASAAGEAYIIPLSFLWDGERLILGTPEASRTARNLRRAGSARVALPSTEDIVIIDGAVDLVPADGAASFGHAFAAAAGFDPRVEAETYVYLRITPLRIQARRDAAELGGRTIMREGRWLDE
jgi:hypothetical protein